MVTPAKGDFAGVPLTPAARKLGLAWDPVKDEAKEQCKAYGAAAIMRVPGRVHITWQDDDTLKIETDAGTQTRLLRFAPGGSQDPPLPGAGTPSWQGNSVANWEGIVRGTGSPDFLPIALNPREGTRGRSLEVVTTNLRAGYLRKNGVPYSARTTVREYYNLSTERNGSVNANSVAPYHFFSSGITTFTRSFRCSCAWRMPFTWMNSVRLPPMSRAASSGYSA